MVLRARFFLMAWRSHTVAHPDYSLQTQFISRESYDIFLTLCDGLLSLMIAYRNYYPTYPLLPWLHSTEVCEHLFGMLRQLKKDFTYSDVLQLERKLRVLQMGAFGNLTAKQQANETAAGYHHTYFNANDVDLLTLMQSPTDQELKDASQYDYKDPEPASTRPMDAPRSRPPNTFLQLLALYEKALHKSLRDEESLAITALPDSTDESLEQLRTDIQNHLAFDADSVCVLSNARAENKATVQKVAAMKFVGHRAKAFVGFQWVHENMHLANISDFNPLKPGHLFIGLKPGSSAQVVLCEMVTMYTKNTMHDWIPSATSVGTPSYVYAAVYQPLAGRMFSSMSCELLTCGATLQFPRTHILFSLASFTPTITRQDIPTAEGYPHTLITLCERSFELLSKLRANQKPLYLAVEELTGMAKAKHADTDLPLGDTAGMDDAPSEESDTDL
ncbi:hypothetical protein B0H14DRAFT_3554351 [Mycena olivaceomarginata]|nr:hypothetical protein B0H14DRAFT_3554351 [Mycena olivaceomarginata]